MQKYFLHICSDFSTLIFDMAQSKQAAEPKFKKVKWKTVVNQWTALNPAEKLVALPILARSGKEGWATLSLGELRKMSGELDYRTLKKAIKHLGYKDDKLNGPGDG